MMRWILVVFLSLCGWVTAAEVDWDTLGFAPLKTRSYYIATGTLDGEWDEGGQVAHGMLEVSPASCVLNYGQGLFEGLKAYRTEEGRIILFRPRDNARRFARGARRLGMPPVPEEMFLKAIKETILANKEWVPPAGKGTLYVRPLLLGTGELMTLTPAPSYTFLVFVTPVGPYFNGGLKGIDLLISEEYHRAHPGGVGDIKSVSNYSSGFVPLQMAKKQGYAELLYLDVTNRYIEEVGAANFFCVKDGVLYTPELTGTILPGITRDSLMKLARGLGYEVRETKVTPEFALEADEAFCCGTAAVICPIGSLTYKGRKVSFNDGVAGPVTRKLYALLTGIQSEREADRFGWLEEVSGE